MLDWNLDPNCQNEDLNDELQNEKVGKSSSASPVYQKLSKHSTGQLSNQQPDSQSSNNNNSVKIGKSSYRFFILIFYLDILRSMDIYLEFLFH